MILGIDEVGRGAWAGPLVVGAVVLGGTRIEGLTDSKVLSKKRRELLYDKIMAKAASVGLGWVNSEEIDEIGLSEALRLATRRAVQEVQRQRISFQEIIIDGTVNFLQGTALQKYTTTIKKADLLVPSVSAASIVAKVARDRFMFKQHELYPVYGFSSHVGYGTAAHRATIESHGVTPLHRLSVLPLQKYATVAASERSTQNKVSRQATRDIGNCSEAVATEELSLRGHEIIARNWRTKYCEIDIVSRKDDTYYFAEVKHRKSGKSGDGLAAITPKKLNQMKFAAKLYAHTQKISDKNLQLLAIATTGDPPRITSIINTAE